ncbi:MAG: hypothetical protein MJZ69_09045 [Bacteroidaceae bacterium]|nr:hypothetical protein [Bacteroidaceae bacterium]
MKNLKHFFLLLVAFCALFALYNCGDDAPRQHQQLQAAEEIMWDMPDSALHVLESIDPSSLRGDQQHALYALLMTQAQIKNNVTVKSDSLINIALDYFKDKADAPHKAAAYHYKGMVSYNSRKDSTAIHYFLEAEKLIPEINNYRLAYQIYYWQSMVYLFRNMTEYADTACNKCYCLAEEHKDTVNMVFALRNKSRVFHILKQYDKAIDNYKKVIELASNQIQTRWTVVTELGTMYLLKEDYQQAKKYTWDSYLGISREKNADKLNVINIIQLGQIYTQLGMADSADYFLQKAMKSDLYINQKSVVTNNLRHLHQNTTHNYKLALEYDQQYRDIQDSIRKQEQIQAIAEMRERYNQQKAINERNEAIIVKDKVIKLALAACLILLALVLLFQYKVILKNRELKKQDEKVHALLMQIQENSQLVSKNEESVGKREEFLTLQLIKRLNLVSDLHKKPRVLKEGDWTILYSTCNEYFDQFMERLAKNYPALTSLDLQMCCLMKLRFSIYQMSELLCIDSKSVSRRKTRLKEHLFGDSPEKRSISLDSWVQEY